MRRSILAAVLALALLAVPAQAQVNQEGLAPFIGKYTDAPGGERFNVYITSRSALIATWYFGGACGLMPYPCEPPNGSIGNVPGGQATAVLWRAEGDGLTGDVLSTDQGDFFPADAIHVKLLPNRGIELQVGDKIWSLERVR